MTSLICIGCPKGCHLTVDEENDYKVTGNSCATGAEYGRNELLNPTRVLTTTVLIEGAIHNCLPVKSNGPIPKGKLIDCARYLADVKVQSPVVTGQVIVENILDTGIDVIATKDM